MGGAGFEPAKAVPSDLQSDPFDRSGNPPFSKLKKTRPQRHEKIRIRLNGDG